MNVRLSVALAVVALLPFSLRAEAAPLFPLTISGGAQTRACTGGCGLPDGPTGVNVSSSTSYSSASNTLDLSKAPYIAAEAFAALPVGALGASDFFADGGASAFLSYGFTVVGPTLGLSVPVRVVAKMGTTITGGLYTDYASISAYARLFIGSSANGASPAISNELRKTYPTGENPGTLSATSSYDAYYSFSSGIENIVLMQVSAGASVATTRPPFVSIGNASAKAFVDPYFEIDPEYVKLGYSLVFTEGIRNSLTAPEDEGDPDTPPVSPVPLPASGLLLGGVLLGLAGLTQRQRAV